MFITNKKMISLFCFVILYVSGICMIVWHNWARGRSVIQASMHAQTGDDAFENSIYPLKQTHLIQGVAIIVPTRDRDWQWSIFKRHMCKFWTSNSTRLHVWRIEQTQKGSFNRARLFNVGFKLHQQIQQQTSCIAVNDVDLLPEQNVDFTTCPWPTHVSSEPEHFQWRVPYPNYVGGVFMASPEYWLHLNGMSNSFWGWGGEDDELYERIKIKGLLIEGNIMRPMHNNGRFKKLSENHHVRTRIDAEYNNNVALIHGMRDGTLDPTNDGLNQTVFERQGEIQIESGGACGNPLVTFYTANVSLLLHTTHS
jgi:hypothetical protein